MYLKSLELSGFKSFAKKSTLDFTTAITAIVGPNGSGKSNIAEAFRFVLGEQSIKSMRGKRGEDLIFNGSHETARGNMARVKVVFDNNSRFLEVDFDEVSIERIVHRDGVNEYFINGSSVRLKDIAELLSAAHVGSSGHHIISQGEADRILNSSPRLRKAIIEDALGLTTYQYKITESERKLTKTEENIREIELLRREIAPHLRFLKRQVEKIEKTQLLRKELQSLYKEYFKREDFYISHTEKELEKKTEPLKEKMEILESQSLRVQNSIEISKEKDVKSTDLINLEKAQKEKREEKDEKVRELGRLEGQITSEKRVVEREQERINSVEKRLIQYTEVETFVQSLLVRLESSHEFLTIESAQSVIKDLQVSLKDFLNKNTTFTDGGVITDAEAVIATLQKTQQECEHVIDVLEKEEQGIRDEYTKIQQSIEDEKDTNRDAEKELFRIRSEKNEITLLLKTIDSEYSRVRVEKNNLFNELQEAGTLIGADAIHFQNCELQPEEMKNEKRDKQEERLKMIERLKIKLEDTGITSGGDVLKEYTETNERDEFLARELEDLKKTAESLRGLISDLATELHTKFEDGVSKINKEFKEFFSLMFGGGSASLSLVKEQSKSRNNDTVIEEDDFSLEEDEERLEGIDITVSLPRKKIKGLQMLSGGERALASIALLFAMSQVTPPPFIILDETDAALDEANSRKYAEMVKSLSKNSELILITHNRETMSCAGVLYGITMESGGVSHLLSIQLEEAVAVAK